MAQEFWHLIHQNRGGLTSEVVHIPTQMPRTLQNAQPVTPEGQTLPEGQQSLLMPVPLRDALITHSAMGLKGTGQIGRFHPPTELQLDHSLAATRGSGRVPTATGQILTVARQSRAV